MWKGSYRNARCVVPAEGWYEWSDAQRTDPHTGEIRSYRQPYFIGRPDRGLIGFAGLMSFWYPDTDSMVLTCAIVTRAAAGPAASLHDRMPVVLQESDIANWLDPSVKDADEVTAMIQIAQTNFEHYAVTTRLNVAEVDDERLLEPV
jgi:putative SOS response-associated peptidase YedK